MNFKIGKLDIIEKVDDPALWISPIVVVQKKNDSIRICVDMRLPNKAIPPGWGLVLEVTTLYRES